MQQQAAMQSAEGNNGRNVFEHIACIDCHSVTGTTANGRFGPDLTQLKSRSTMLDGWTNVFQVPGKRTTGGKAQKYAITGPGWSGLLPEGVTEYKSPTDLVWILGRIYCTGTPSDYAAVHELQDKFALVPLSSYGKPYQPAMGTVDANFNMKAAVRDQVD